MHRNPTRTGNCPRCVPADRGPAPYVVNVSEAARRNHTFRTALWTGAHLQMTLMQIPVNGEIGVEVHPDTDQYIRIEEGQAMVTLGCCRDRLDDRRPLNAGVAVLIPAGTWHNIVNTGGCPLALSSVYAPPHHPRGTVHQTRQDAEQSGH